MEKPRTILVVEDEPIIAAAIAARLRKEAFRVETAGDGLEGVRLNDELKPDLVVLDVMLPGLDGLEVCRRIQNGRPVPVLMLTARDSETDVLVGLGVGADDYMTKPFSTRELVARVHALLRRVDRAKSVAADPSVMIGGVEIDPMRRQVLRDGESVHLTPLEFDLLYLLASHPEVVYSRGRLLNEVWGYEDENGARTIDSHIGALRRKLGRDLVRTVHGVGYAVSQS
jgi:DNA-binding response OmpR family regulator